MKTFIQKISSRKFIASIAGIATGIGVIISGNVIEGVIAVLASVFAYLITEGYIDAKAIDITDKVVDTTKDMLSKEENNG